MPEGLADKDIALVIDVDGALLKTDLLVESAFALLVKKPWFAARLPLWLLSGKAGLKREIANRCDLIAESYPWDDNVLELMGAARAAGRRVYLASASDEKFVRAIADYLGRVDGVFASDGVTNLSRQRKARKLVEAFGEKGFDYVGNSRDDLPVWKSARQAIVVNPRSSLIEAARRVNGDVHAVGTPPLLIAGLIRALRPIQWLKNLLVFVPIVAAHALDGAHIASALAAFAAFSLAASSAYMVNDLADLPHDRAHPRKRKRPFASGDIPVVSGLIAAPLLLAVAIVIMAMLSATALLTVAAYYVITLAYSFSLKRRPIMDVMTLAALYTIRIVGGGAAAGAPVSEWLLAFSVFLFLSLAVVKRCGELARHEIEGNDETALAGRGYRADDLQLLAGLGAAAGFCAVLVLALYINSDQVMTLYAHPHVLWACCFILIYWISRMMLLAHRGDIHDDPVVFAATDRGSIAAFILMAIAVLIAA